MKTLSTGGAKDEPKSIELWRAGVDEPDDGVKGPLEAKE